jgi:phosphonate transport system substrate-binding protein
MFRKINCRGLVLASALVVASLLLVACPPRVVVVTPTPAPLGTKENPIVMAFVPSGEFEDIVTGAETITSLLKEKTGYEIEGMVAMSYSAVIEAMCAEKAHMGTLATFSYLLANEKCGVDVALVAVRYGSPYYKGQIIVGAETGIKTIADLKGKTACWVDAASTSGYIIPRIMLKAAGIEPDKDLAQQTEVGSHPSVVLAVYKGECDFGATWLDARVTIKDEFPDVMEKVLVIAESDEIPNDGLQFIAGFPKEMRERIVKAFLEIMETDEGVEAMGLAYGWESVAVKDDSFYDPFRATLDAAGVDIKELAE